MISRNKLNHKYKYKYYKFDKYEKFETVQIKLRTGEPENWWRIEGAVHFFKDATQHIMIMMMMMMVMMMMMMFIMFTTIMTMITCC